MLDLNTSTDRERELAQVVCQLTNQLQEKAGVDIEALAEQHPEFADELHELLPSMQLLLSMGDGPSKPAVMGTVDAGVPAELPQLHVLGDFRILRELGRGGMGVVYEAQQVSMGRKVALKVLPFAALAQENSLQRFRNEVRAAGALNHPSIVPIHSVGEERGVHFFAMQLIRGQTMAEVIAQLVHLQHEGQPLHDDSISQAVSAAEGSKNVGGSVDEPTNGSCRRQTAEPPRSGERSYSASSQSSQETRRETQARISTEGGLKRRSAFIRSATRLGVQAAEALQHAHESGVLHRDIKPGNLMLDAEGQLYITDFGLARIESDVGMTMTGDLIGTLRYMSPEQALAKRIVIDHRSDIYSLGVTLYELLTLRAAFEGADRQELLRQIAFDDPPKPRQINRSIPAELQTIILKAIEKNPGERYNTAGELADDLRAFLEDRPIKAKPPTPIQRAAKWSRRHGPLVRTTVATVGIAVAIGGVLLWNERSRTLAALARESTQHENAETNLAAALDAVDKMLAHASDPELKEMPQAAAVRKRILVDALTFYEQFKASSGDSPEVRYRAAMVRVELAHANTSNDEQFYREGRAQIFEKATSELERLVKEFPTETRYRLGLAKALGLHAFRLMWIQEGAESLAQQRKLGIVLYEREKAEYDRLRALDRANAEAYQAEILECSIDLAEAYRLVGDRELASTIVGRVRELIGDQSPLPESNAYRLLARATHELALDLRGSDAEGAKTLFRESIDLDSAMGTRTANRDDRRRQCVRYKLAAEFFLHQDSINEAERYADKAMNLANQLVLDFPSVLEYRKKLSRLHELHGDLRIKKSEREEALAYYDKAIEIIPECSAYKRRGEIYLDRRQYEKALSDFSKSIELRPDYSYTYKRHGLTHFHLGNFEDALADIAKAGELNPEDTSNLTWISPALVAACPDQAFRDGMLELADKTVELSGESAGAHAARGSLLGALGHKERAFADYDKAIELNPDKALLCNNLAWFTASNSDADPVLVVRRAVKLAERAVSLEPSRAIYWNTLGVVQYRAADFDAAIESLETSEELSNREHFGLDGIFIAMAHWQLGHEDEARDWYDRAVEWIEANSPDEELIRFRAEAEELMGISDIGREP